MATPAFRLTSLAHGGGCGCKLAPSVLRELLRDQPIADVYAMGGRPLMALAILGMPLGKIAPETVREILAGGAEVCARAGIPIAGGHSIDAPEPIYGLAVIGSCKANEVRRNSDAQA